MIEGKDILKLCSRFEDYLMPLDIHVLRQRYNGKVLKSTYAVGRDMGLSDETVRTIDNPALDALAHRLAREEEGQPITSMRLARTFWPGGSLALYVALTAAGFWIVVVTGQLQ